MSKRKPAYRVQIGSWGCSKCGNEKEWLVIQPDDVALGRTFDNPNDAEEMAEELNRAYELGRKSAAKKPAKRRK